MSDRALFWLGGILAVIVALVYWCALPIASESGPQEAGIANPASVNCVNRGGEIEIAQDPGGGAIGYCHLKDGRVCEEWSLMRDNRCIAPTS
jgi:putative hemolysin